MPGHALDEGSGAVGSAAAMAAGRSDLQSRQSLARCGRPGVSPPTSRRRPRHTSGGVRLRANDPGAGLRHDAAACLAGATPAAACAGTSPSVASRRVRSPRVPRCSAYGFRPWRCGGRPCEQAVACRRPRRSDARACSGSPQAGAPRRLLVGAGPSTCPVSNELSVAWREVYRPLRALVTHAAVCAALRAPHDAKSRQAQTSHRTKSAS